MQLERFFVEKIFPCLLSLFWKILSVFFSIFQLERFCLMATSRASLGLIPFCTSISAFKVNKWTLNKNTMISILIFVIVVSDQWGRCSRSQRRSWAQSVQEGRRSRCWTAWDAWGGELVGARHVNMWSIEKNMLFYNENISLVSWHIVCKSIIKIWI